MKKLTIFISALALVCFAVPAMAVDWNFYGNARMATFYTSTDFGDGLNAAGTDDSDTDLQWDMQSNSRIGANIKAENIKAQFEFAVKSTSGGGGDVSSRRLYGVWDFGAGKLKIGKDYTPVSQFISGQVFDGDLGLLGVGTMYGNRTAQLALSFGAFEIALMQMNTGLITGMTAGATIGNGDVDEVLPKVELGWGMSFDTWNFNLMGGAQYYSIEDVSTATGSEDVEVTSYVIGGTAGWNIGPGYVKGALSVGQNIGNAAWGIPGLAGSTSGQGGLAEWDGDDDTNDVYTSMAALVGGLKVSDMLSFEAGVGYRHDSVDGASGDTTPIALYVQSVIALAPGVYIIPEIGYYDYDNNATGDDAGSLIYGGAKWQVNF